MEKKILLVDCDGVVSESFNGKKLKHLLVQGIEDEKVVFEARVGLKQSKLTYPDAVRFVEQQGGKLGDKMLWQVCPLFARRLILKRRNCNLMAWKLICCLKTGIGAVRRHRKIIL